MTWWKFIDIILAGLLLVGLLRLFAEWLAHSAPAEHGEMAG